MHRILFEKIQAQLQLADTSSELLIPVGVSNRHIHLSTADRITLFGADHPLTKLRDLKQTGQFAANESVIVVGPKGAISRVRVLGPERSKTQVELSQTDCMALGIKAPLRESGHLEGAAAITVVGPNGSVYCHENAICAKRHIHMSPQDALIFGVENGQKVAVKALGDRSLVFHEVVIRVDPSYTLEMHIDTDEANATLLSSKDFVWIHARH